MNAYGRAEAEFHASLPSVLDGGGQLHTAEALPSRKELPAPTGYEAGWTWESMWGLWRRENLALPTIEHGPSCSYKVLWYIELVNRTKWPSEGVRERERECEWEWVRVREWVSECECESEWEREWERECVCVCVWEWERERERACVRVCVCVGREGPVSEGFLRREWLEIRHNLS
jgi:hypothetical protein